MGGRPQRHGRQPFHRVALAALLIAVPAAADDEPLSPDPVPLALTVSGGVSLGAYQAGFLYYLTETIKRNPELAEYTILTGASAGMINSLFALLSAGGEPEPDPTESLFYRFWTGIKWQDLVDVEQTPRLAVFSRGGFAGMIALIRERWERGLDPKVDMVLGATATRLRSTRIALSEGLTVSRQEERFVFRVHGRGPGREPAVSNYVDPGGAVAQPLLPFNDPDEPRPGAERDNFDVLLDVLFASSALPLVFEAQEIEFCLAGGFDPVEGAADADGARICPSPTERAAFADGALVDKWPMRLAYRTARAGLERGEDGRLAWRTVPDREPGGPATAGLFFVYLDPEDAAYPALPPPTAERRRRGRSEVGLFEQLGVFFGGYLVSAQAKELYTLVEEHPEIRDRMRLASRDLPSASGLMANFFGFFDRKFRAYDFYLGMRDARAFVESTLTSQVRRVTSAATVFALPEPGATDLDPAWRPFFCLRRILDGDDRHPDACDGAELEDFRILLQASLDRLHDHCSRLPADEKIVHPRCAEAQAGAPPLRVYGVRDPGGDHWRSRPAETEFAHMLRLLEDYEFHFEDLGLDRDQARRAMGTIREELLRIVDRFGKKLPWGERQMVRVLGKPAVNFFKYAPPRVIIYFGAGKGAELGFSTTGKWVPSRWLRLNLALQGQGLVQLISSVPDVFALTPLAGIELEIPRINGPMVQSRGGLRAGYQLSTNDGFHTGTCETERFEGDPIRCSAPVFQGFLALGFYERIRLQIVGEWIPAWLPPADELGRHRLNWLLEVGWQWISPF
jgi:predicted acylesterase/phospholipase RssA